MKRSKTSTKAMRRRKTENRAEGSSPYGLKFRSGKQMYGPGCCAHHLAAKILAAR